MTSARSPKAWMCFTLALAMVLSAPAFAADSPLIEVDPLAPAPPSASPVAATGVGTTTDATAHYRLQRLYLKHRFDSPVALAVMPLPEPRHVIMQQRGEVWLLPQDEVLGTPERFLDFREKLKDVILFEEGFHGLAFHPDFAQNGRFYISYSTVEPRRTIVSEMRVMEGNNTLADPATERILLEIPHIMANHFSGCLAFGPDGKLYATIGDGGLRDDPYRLAQNPFSLHGKMLRIDVDTRSGALPYGIPKDNPFADKQEWRPEIWALGLRNPWGFAFDRVTGQLWLADVGQDLWEEVNIIKKGGNYGWSDRDGPKPASFHAMPFLPERTYEEPIHAYLHSEGVSITGGFVYRGQRLPRLEGCYLYGDWGFGTLTALRYDPDSRTVQETFVIHRRAEGAEIPFNPTMISEDASGEVVILSQEGSVYTLVPAE